MLRLLLSGAGRRDLQAHAWMSLWHTASPLGPGFPLEESCAPMPDVSHNLQQKSLPWCAGFGWDRVNFLPSSWYGAMFQICAENGADDTGMFSLLLSSAYTESRPFPLLTPPHQRRGWGCGRSWEGTQLGQLTPADQRDIPYHMMSYAQHIKLGEEEGKWVTFGVMAFCLPK